MKAAPPPLSRSSGILMHVTSLPGKYGIGDLGPAAYRWVDWLSRAGQTWWQVLPMGPAGAGNSPYQSYSAFAGNPLLISPEMLFRDGLLRKRDLRAFELPPGPVDYDVVAPLKTRLLVAVWQAFRDSSNHPLQSDYHAFCAEQSEWLDDYALFSALREVHKGAAWNTWPHDLVCRAPAALSQARQSLAGEIDLQRFTQFLFFRQLRALREHGRSKGVRLIGDLPIFVSGESADVWANPELFLLDRSRRPRAVAGVPPDYFSATGQRWGNPLYDWTRMKRDGFAWWVRRAKAALEQADLVRIDHFRGFESYWKIPASAPTAQTGKWTRAPGRALFKTLRQALGGLPFIAEDLGLITDEVEALRDEFHLPGMRVLQFAFGSDSKNPFLPHNHIQNTVAYTGTHDNDTTVGWHRSLKSNERKRLNTYFPGASKDPAGALLRLTWSSVANIAIAPVQDLLNLDSRARMNIPGTPSKNWTWRLPDEKPLTKALEKLMQLTMLYARESRGKAGD